MISLKIAIVYANLSFVETFETFYILKYGQTVTENPQKMTM